MCTLHPNPPSSTLAIRNNSQPARMHETSTSVMMRNSVILCMTGFPQKRQHLTLHKNAASLEKGIGTDGGEEKIFTSMKPDPELELGPMEPYIFLRDSRRSCVFW